MCFQFEQGRRWSLRSKTIIFRLCLFVGTTDYSLDFKVLIFVLAVVVHHTIPHQIISGTSNCSSQELLFIPLQNISLFNSGTVTSHYSNRDCPICHWRTSNYYIRNHLINPLKNISLFRKYKLTASFLSSMLLYPSNTYSFLSKLFDAPQYYT